ncbi:MAG: NAD(P)/FAD-dependent oxidoreductase, partial [Candidatus Cryptobacteroides sp.]
MVEFEVSCRIGREPRLDDIRTAAAEALHLRKNAVINVIDPTKSYQPTMVNADAHCHIVHRSIDARGDVTVRYRIEAYKKYEKYEEYHLPEYKDVAEAEPVIVVGSGPAGMFASLKLLTLGLKPVMLERGKDVSGRKPDIARLSRNGVVNPDSNYCYGEGGAGTFSDGKLFTRSSKRGDNREVLYQFVNFGADPSILIDAHPHIGTDKLPRLVSSIRECILEHGGECHFQTKVTDIERSEDGTFTVTALDGVSGDNVTYRAKSVILATGHSAKDIYELFDSK